MKKVFSILLLGVLFQMSVTAQDKQNKAWEVKEFRDLGAALPTFLVVDSNHNQYSRNDFKQKGNFFLFMFNPTCGHCIQMAKLITDHRAEFSGTNILFMAGGNMQPYLASFYQASGIAKAPEIIVGLDTSATIEKLMVFQGLPQLNIYDSKGILIKIKTGDIPLDTLKYYRGY